MSIWKSPVLYLGLLLVMLVGGALLAPFVVDWGSYRGALQSYGTKIFGRTVTVAGPIAVRLFPWPRLEAEDVRIANAVGFGAAPMAEAGKLTVNLALAGLASGQIRVESIVLENPVINLALDQQGQANWHLQADQAPKQGGLLHDVLLEQITVTNGAINFADARHHIAQSLTGISGLISAAAPEGPWRAKGKGAFGALPISLFVATGEVKPGQDLAVTITAQPLDGSLPSLSFDGSGLGGDWKGKVQLDPVVTEDGRSSLSGLLKPLSYAAQVTLHGDSADLSAIHIVSADPKDSGTLIEGDGKIDFLHGVTGDLALKAPHINLDALANAGNLRLDQAGGLMGYLNALLARFPDALALNSTLEASAFTLAGETLENVSLQTSATSGGLRVQDFSAGLPGRAKVKFNGLVFPGKDSAELGGQLALESGDARGLANWLWPDGRESIARLWTGAHGRLKLQSDVDLSKDRLGLQNVEYELDGVPGRGTVAVSGGAAPAIDVALSGREFALGDYVGGTLSPASLFAALPGLLPGEAGFQKKMLFDFGKVTLNGASAEQVKVEANASAAGFELKQFDIGSVEGAELRGNGLILVGPDGPNGEVKFALGAKAPQGFLRLIGLMPKGPDPVWARALGGTDMRADLTVKPGKAEPQVSYSLSGSSGALRLVGTGTVSDLLAAGGQHHGISGTVTAQDARDLLRLIGIDPKGGAASEGQVSLTADGTAASGYKTVVDFEGMGASFGFDGLYKPAAGFPEFQGRIKLLADDAKALLEALGSPAAASGALAIDGVIAPKDGGDVIAPLTAKIGEQDFTGNAAIGAGGVKLSLKGGDVRLSDLAPLALAPWSGLPNWANARLDARGPFGLKGAVSLSPATLTTPLGGVSHGAVLSMQLDDTGRTFSMKDAGGAWPTGFDAKLAQQEAAFTLNGHVTLPVVLDAALGAAAGVSGNGVIDARISSSGFTPAALAANVSGAGNFAAGDVKLAGLDPDAFFAALASAKTADEQAKAASHLKAGAGVALPAQTVPLTIKDGALSTAPLAGETQQARLKLSATIDVPAAQVRGDLALQSKAQADWPELHVVYAGTSGAVAQKVDASALSSKLGAVLIAKDMAALEQVQKDQAKAEADAAALAAADKAKFDAYQAQRAELRLFQRMDQVFARQRGIDAAHVKAELEAAIAAGQAINAEEKRRLMQRLAH